MYESMRIPHGEPEHKIIGPKKEIQLTYNEIQDEQGNIIAILHLNTGYWTLTEDKSEWSDVVFEEIKTNNEY